MTNQTDGGAKKKPFAGLGSRANWPLLRKFETLVFGCMLCLLPFFALKVANVTTTELSVKKTSADLVKDLRRARQLAKENAANITVTSRPASPLDPSAYLIQDDQRTIEEILLPKGVSMKGTVKFDQRGVPAQPAEFVIAKGQKQAKVEVDANGMITAP